MRSFPWSLKSGPRCCADRLENRRWRTETLDLISSRRVRARPSRCRHSDAPRDDPLLDYVHTGECEMIGDAVGGMPLPLGLTPASYSSRSVYAFVPCRWAANDVFSATAHLSAERESLLFLPSSRSSSSSWSSSNSSWLLSLVRHLSIASRHLVPSHLSRTSSVPVQRYQPRSKNRSGAAGEHNHQRDRRNSSTQASGALA
jgi:hypothetical protein